MRVSVDNLGSVGLVRDLFSHETPPEAWTTLRNARMGPNGMEKFLGHEKALGTDSAGWAIPPYWLFFAPRYGASSFWICAGQNKVYARDAITPFTEYNITRQSASVDVNYSATPTTKWNGGPFGGLFILNNGQDQPQFWSPVSGATRLANFSTIGTSPWDANWRCDSIASFGRFLVAINILKTSTRYQNLVKWSHPADFGSMPSSWDHTNPAVDAGEFPLQDALGDLTWQEVLRNQNILYTDREAWSMTWVGGTDIFKFERIFGAGVLTKNCVARFKNKGEFHAVLGTDDIYIHQGQTVESILEPALRRWFFAQIDVNYFRTSFVVANPAANEIWFCVPELGAEQPTLALVWNWLTGAIGFRDLLTASSGSDTRGTAGTNGTPCISAGRLDNVASEPWSGDANSWESDAQLWDQQLSNPNTLRLLMADRSAGKRTFLCDSSGGFDGGNIALIGERIGLSIIGRDRNGAAKNDSSVVKLLTEIWPRFTFPVGTEVEFYVGSQQEQTEGVAWNGPYTYTVGSQAFITPYISGRYLSIRVTYTGQAVGNLLGYDLVLELSGAY